ncbi:hypothetical protein Vretimale_8542 [Volvox reticuliferus]|uniref:Uncharacterized protein n=1 Tax=Volvox reticuliferus TaxID=1737510 RepID=A0A8J4LMT4_9CHLO|nr:hypothetical protein Vretifemale_11635 [Volvox reticuliferus]GIM03867.1 hypothetical protein Vretimale_8542 [Volvox reticuliferus]
MDPIGLPSELGPQRKVFPDLDKPATLGPLLVRVLPASQHCSMLQSLHETHASVSAFIVWAGQASCRVAGLRLIEEPLIPFFSLLAFSQPALRLHDRGAEELLRSRMRATST